MKTPALLGLACSLAAPTIAWADDTQTVLRSIHRINQAVVEAASLAQQHGVRADVRAYGRRLEMDHRFADGKVLALAGQLQLSATGPASDPNRATEEAMRHQQLTDRLAELKLARGADFDRAFVQLMRVVHAYQVDSLSTAQYSTDPQVGRLLDGLIPIFEQHVELAVHLTGTDERRAEAGR